MCCECRTKIQDFFDLGLRFTLGPSLSGPKNWVDRKWKTPIFRRSVFRIRLASVIAYRESKPPSPRLFGSFIIRFEKIFMNYTQPKSNVSRLLGLVCLPLFSARLLAQEVSTLSIEQSTDMQNWQVIEVTSDILDANGNIQIPNSTTERFFRLGLTLESGVAPVDMALIPGSTFIMGNSVSEDVIADAPPVSVNVSSFYMAKHEVTKNLWNEVRTWGLANGYTDLSAGGGKADKHPIHSITWFDMVKWCNARSEMEGFTPVYTISNAVLRTGTGVPDADWFANGYRLPTEAEWEKAARGGVTNQRFVWGDVIVHYLANYASNSSDAYDESPTSGFHPTYLAGGQPYSSPVGSFPANNFGLYDMAGNSWEACWDFYDAASYEDAASDPRGPETGSSRVLRGGGWKDRANTCRLAYRLSFGPSLSQNSIGFRVARNYVP